MTDYFIKYQREIIESSIWVLIFLILKFISTKAIRKIGTLKGINKIRTRLIVKYISTAFFILISIALIIIWGINFNSLIPILSSVFAILGIALFANWSILSNVTSGVILFFSFPYKIGDKIRIIDKDIDTNEAYLIEDIKAYHIHLSNTRGELLTYPNSLILQKPIVLVETYEKSLTDK